MALPALTSGVVRLLTLGPFFRALPVEEELCDRSKRVVFIHDAVACTSTMISSGMHSCHLVFLLCQFSRREEGGGGAPIYRL